MREGLRSLAVLGLAVLVASGWGVLFVGRSDTTAGGDVPAGGGTTASGGPSGGSGPSVSDHGAEPTPTGGRTSGYGTCPGAPPIGGGIERHPDTAREADGTLLMVWQERFGDQFEICYTRGPEFGLGTAVGPAIRITNTQGDSVLPHVAIDAASDIAYVLWNEEIHHHAVGFVPVEFDEDYPVLMYTAAALFEPGDPMWTSPLALSDGGRLSRFFVSASHYSAVLLQQGRVQLDRDWNGDFDTDGDGIKDSDEVLAVLGYRTLWWRGDTDDDRLLDLIEIQYAFDPTLHVTKQFPQCFPRGTGGVCDLIFNLLCLVIDLDGDGFSLCGEGQDFPVTTEVAGFTHGGSVAYRFWPKLPGTYNLVLRTQMRTYVAGNCTSVSVAVTADGGAVGTLTLPWDDSNPPWSIETAATFNVTGIDFTAVTASQAVDVDLDVSFDPPACGQAILAVLRQLAIDWLKLELDGFRSEVNYKDADDFLDDPAPPSYLVDVSTEDMVIRLDADQKDVLLEIDSMTGHPWDAQVLNEAINAYSDHNIILNYKVSETGLSQTEVVKAGSNVGTIASDWPATSTDESSLYLSEHRDASLAALRYIHVMNAHHGSGCGMAEQSAVAGAADLSGVILYDQDMIDDLCGLADIPDLFSLRLVALIHELAHAFNTAHEKSTGFIDCVIDDCTPLPGFDTCNAYNLAVGGGYCFAASLFDKELLGIGNTDRRFGATEPIGRPRYSIETDSRFDFTSLLSVEAGNNVVFLDDYV
ncbi:MAG TPA: hypothetical protein VGR51_05440 [Thermoplasmata archaeon]|nr:hypothetical protein [Thermoplasmata archaeon]